MVFSEYLSAAKAAVRHVQGSVRYRGLNTGGGWIRHPTELTEKFVARAGLMWLDAVTRREYAHKEANWETFVDEWRKQALSTQTGNCSELSALAYRYLQEKGIRPVEYFGVYRGSWNHAFVILNRDQSVPIHDFAKWSYRAVVCDPLYDRAGDAGFLATWYPKMFPLRDGDRKLVSGQ